MQDLDGASDLVVAPDDRIELALLGALGHVDGELLERLTLLFGVGVVHVLAAAHPFDGLLDRALARARLAHGGAQGPAVLQRGQHEELRGDVLIVALLGELVGLIQESVQIVADMDIAARALHGRQPVELIAQRRTQPIHVDVGARQQMTHRAAFLIQQGDHQMQRLDELVIPSHGQALRIRQGHLKLRGQLVHSHGE